MNQIEKGYIIICDDTPLYEGEILANGIIVYEVRYNVGTGRNYSTGEYVKFKPEGCVEASIQDYIKFLEFQFDEKIPHDQKIEYYRARMARGIDEQLF